MFISSPRRKRGALLIRTNVIWLHMKALPFADDLVNPIAMSSETIETVMNALCALRGKF